MPKLTSKATKADIQQALSNAISAHNDSLIEHEDFKSRVVEIAKAQKDSEDWCDEGFKEAMTTLGLADRLTTIREINIKLNLDLFDQLGYEAEDLSTVGEDELKQTILEHLSSVYRPDFSKATFEITVPESDDVVLFDSKPNEASSKSSSYYGDSSFSPYSGY